MTTDKPEPMSVEEEETPLEAAASTFAAKILLRKTGGKEPTESDEAFGVALDFAFRKGAEWQSIADQQEIRSLDERARVAEEQVERLIATRGR